MERFIDKLGQVLTRREFCTVVPFVECSFRGRDGFRFGSSVLLAAGRWSRNTSATDCAIYIAGSGRVQGSLGPTERQAPMIQGMPLQCRPESPHINSEIHQYLQQ
jgi:hypothetical protein